MVKKPKSQVVEQPKASIGNACTHCQSPRPLDGTAATTMGATLKRKRWLTEAHTAEILDVSQKFLQKKRLTGGGIPFVKDGARFIRYRMKDIIAYERKHLKRNTSET